MKTKILQGILFIGTYFIFSINLYAIEHSEKVGEYKRINVSNKIQLYKNDTSVDENKITIFKYNIKDLNLSFQVLNLGYEVRFIKWKDEIIPLIQPADGTDYFSFFYSKKNKYYLLADLMTHERPRYDVVQINNDKLKYLGITERDNTTNFTDNYHKLSFNLRIEKGKPIFYYQKNNKTEENYLTENIGYIFKNLNSKEILYNVYNNKNMHISKSKIKRYFKNFKQYGTPYGKNYLSQKKVQEIKESNKSYQVYQKLNKYDILMMLIKDSNFFSSSKYRTYNEKYADYIDAVTETEDSMRLLIHVKRDLTEYEKQRPSYTPIRSISYNPLNNKFSETIYANGNENILALKYPKVWLKIFNIYHLNKPKEYLYIKEKSTLYKKANLKSKSKKFLIKSDCALIIDKTKDGWYKVFFYHHKWKTNTIMWIKFDADKHGLII